MPFEGWPAAQSAAVIEDAPRRGVSVEHVRGEIDVPDGYTVLEGTPLGERRSVGDRRLALQRRRHEPAARRTRSRRSRRPAWRRTRSRRAGARRVRAAAGGDGAREDAPLRLHRRARRDRARRDAALRLRRRPSARSGLQLAAIETGIPVVVRRAHRRERSRRPRRGSTRPPRPCASALEMADLFAQLRAAARAPDSYTAARRCPRSAQSVARSPAFGNHRSHSMVATKRRFDPNLQRVRVLLNGIADARLRLHPLPQGRQGHQGRLGRLAGATRQASNRV